MRGDLIPLARLMPDLPRSIDGPPVATGLDVQLAFLRLPGRGPNHLAEVAVSARGPQPFNESQEFEVCRDGHGSANGHAGTIALQEQFAQSPHRRDAAASHGRTFDHRRRSPPPLAAMATASHWPTRTTGVLPRVTAV